MNMLKIVLLIIAFASILCFSAIKKQKDVLKFHGMPIYKELTVKYDNDSTFFKIQTISKNSLDGFWTSWGKSGDKGRTQLYLNGILDTSWHYRNNREVQMNYTSDYSSIHFVPIDTNQLYKSLRSKLKKYKFENTTSFKKVQNELFLGITVKRKYTTYYKNGTPNRELLLINNNELDGFWLRHDWQGIYESHIIHNGKVDTTLKWQNNQLLKIIESDTDPEISYGLIVSIEDSSRIVAKIQKLMQHTE